jgi:hypothetical protein
VASLDLLAGIFSRPSVLCIFSASGPVDCADALAFSAFVRTLSKKLVFFLSSPFCFMVITGEAIARSAFTFCFIVGLPVPVTKEDTELLCAGTPTKTAPSDAFSVFVFSFWFEVLFHLED